MVTLLGIVGHCIIRMVKNSHKNQVKNIPKLYKNRQNSSLSKPSKILIEIGLEPEITPSDLKDNEMKNQFGTIYEVSKDFTRLRDRDLIKRTGPGSSKHILTENGINELILNNLIKPDEFWNICCKYFDKNSKNYITADKQKYLVNYIETHYKIPVNMVNPLFSNTANDFIEKTKSRKDFGDIIELLTIFIDRTHQTYNQLYSKLVTKTKNTKFWDNLIDELFGIGFLVMVLDKTGRLKITHFALLVLLWSIHYQYENGVKNAGWNNTKLERRLENQFDSITEKYESFLPKIFSHIKKLKKLTNNNFDEIISLILYTTNNKDLIDGLYNDLIFRRHDNMQTGFMNSLSDLLESGTRIITKHIQDNQYPLILSDESENYLWHLLTSEDKQLSIGIRKLSKKEIQDIPDIKLLQKFIEPLSLFSWIKRILYQTNKLDYDYFLFPHIQKQLFGDFERLISFNFFIRLNQVFEKDKIRSIMKDNNWYYDNIMSIIKYEENNLSVLKTHLVTK